jgi:hypothetical protein
MKFRNGIVSVWGFIKKTKKSVERPCHPPRHLEIRTCFPPAALPCSRSGEIGEESTQPPRREGFKCQLSAFELMLRNSTASDLVIQETINSFDMEIPE